MADSSHDAIKKHLESLRDDVKGSYGRASEQIRVVKDALGKLRSAVQFQGLLSIALVAGTIIGGVVIAQHAEQLEIVTTDYVEEKAEAAATNETQKLRQEMEGTLARERKTTAKAIDDKRRKDKEIQDLAREVAKAEVNTVPPRRTDDEIKGLAAGLDRSDEAVQALARGVAEEVANAAVAKVPARRTDDEIIALATSKDRSADEVRRIAQEVAGAAVAKVPARRTDDEIKALAKAQDWKDSEIRAIAETVAKAAVAGVPARRTDDEIKALIRKETAAVEAAASKLRGELDDLKRAQKAMAEDMKGFASAQARIAEQLAFFRAVAKRESVSSLDLSNADLSKVDMSKVSLAKVNMQKADLKGASFKDATLDDVDLRGADLRGADLRLAGAREVKLTGAIYDDTTQVDKSLLDLKAAGAKKK